MVGSHLIHKTSECLVQLLMMDPPKSVLGLINFNVSVPYPTIVLMPYASYYNQSFLQ